MRIVVGMGEVIEGWDMGLLTMRLGEQCDLFLISKYAFGDEGRPPKIPGKAKIIFRMEMHQIGERKSKKPKILQRSNDELFEEALKNKTEGNEKYKAKCYEDAVKAYKDAVEYLDLITKTDQKIDELKVTSHQNLAMSLNFLERYDEAVFHCEHAILVNENSAKAHYIKS
jgi:tetratricopeptide (TPR) repeat protein